MANHILKDKRIKKPRVYRVLDINEDVTTQQIESFKIGKGEIRFNSPNFTSLFLNVGEKEFEKAKIIYNKVFGPKVSVRQRFDLDDTETILVYDYLEHIQTAIVMLCSSIESLANALIPDDFIFEENIKGLTKKWGKVEIERYKSIVDKLKYIIPQALNIKSASTFKCWSKFLELVKLRNDIIHTKTTTAEQRKDKNSLINLLVDTRAFGLINSAIELLKELNRLIPTHEEYPILYKTETLETINIDNWESLGTNKID